MKKTIINGQECYVDDLVHLWFELTYSSYLVLHRSIMCAMPLEWQEKMVALLEEMDGIIDSSQLISKFTVQARDEKGRFIQDPYANYRHPPEIPFIEQREVQS